MILKQLRTHILSSLSKNYSQEEANSFFYMLTKHYLKLNKIDVPLNFDKIIIEKEQFQFSQAVDRLLVNEPIQYIIGETEFYGLPFKVNLNTLIPRPETEELVDWIVSDLKNNTSEKKILDIGTGSGCIIIALAKTIHNGKFAGVDVSAEALKIAQTNADINKAEVEFIEVNILKQTGNLNGNFDIIVSNPPYVRDLEKTKMLPNVLDNEPHLALFVPDNDPLLFYRKISQFAKKSLNLGGSLYFEINEYLGGEMIQLLENEGFLNIELKQDFFGKDRMIKAMKL
ncbi:peptide chain release factor N(5)-glutamine methyltransferase [Flavobacteriaceae bacterium AU392]|nr:peptide chain release factor N(5)-glutamine methyltransferase [Flavobacteriaceae bacterium]RKM86165.1 peptide chain release factor N(5)-glutamine methyltransferase [Flavobacteriaceae bacterium AU392]